MSPRIVDPKERAATVVAAAVTVFAERGYTAATIAEIAQRAGIGKGTTYEYFESKPALFLASFEREWQAVVEGVERAALSSDHSTSGRLRALSRAVLLGHERMQPLKPAMIEFMRTGQPGASCHRLAAAHRDGVARFRSLAALVLTEGQRRGDVTAAVDADLVAAALVGTLEGLAFQASCDGSIDTARIWEPYLEVVLAGLRPSATAGLSPSRVAARTSPRVGRGAVRDEPARRSSTRVGDRNGSE